MDLANVLLTAAAPKFSSRGKERRGLNPAAFTGTMNFSRSVQQTRSTAYSRTSCGLKVMTNETSMPVATLDALRFGPLMEK